MRTFLLLLASVAVSGCFSSLTLVTVRPDGSGTIELTTTVRKAGLAQFDAMMPDDGGRKKHRLDDWFPEQTAREAGSKLGTGVRFVSSRLLDTTDVLGRSTTYAFDDIRQITLDFIPVLPSGVSGAGGAGFVGDSHFTFDLVDEADRRVLVARFPDAQIEQFDHTTSVTAGADDPEEQARFRVLLRGGRLEIAIEPEQPIVQTNTPHRSGQRVTLLGIDAERLLFDKEAEDRLRLQPGSIDELRFKLHDVAGVTVSLDRDVRIELAVHRP